MLNKQFFKPYIARDGKESVIFWGAGVVHRPIRVTFSADSFPLDIRTMERPKQDPYDHVTSKDENITEMNSCYISVETLWSEPDAFGDYSWRLWEPPRDCQHTRESLIVRALYLLPSLRAQAEKQAEKQG